MKNVKTIGALLLCLGLLSPASVLYAAPQGGKVVGGKASITQSGATTTINQTTDRSVINWHSFNIGQNEKFLHNMPSKNSAGLHRVVGGGGASQIQGLLQSNGNIFVVNPAGVVIHKGAKIDTNSFLATTRDITDDNFMKGNMVFDKPGLANAQIINQGMITVNDRGLAALVAPTVRNEGLIVGKLGKVALASGDSTWKLDMYGDDLISFTVDEKAVNGLYAPSGQTLGVENTGTIKAEGGVVVLTAAQLDGIVGSVVNSGEISASSAEVAGGKITFKGQGDSITLANTGKVDASSTTSKGGSVKMVAENDIKVSGRIDVNGGTVGGDVYIWSDKKTTFDGQIEAKGKDKGGFVETSGNYLKVADTARVYTLADSGRHGEWLLDPTDFVIAAADGDTSGATISESLANNGIVTISSAEGKFNGNGDIFVNDAISWDTNSNLVLNAVRNIYISSNISASGDTASLTINPQKGDFKIYNDAKITLSGVSPQVIINGKTYNIINSLEKLQNISLDKYGNYALVVDLDATETRTWNSGAGFSPISGYSWVNQSSFRGNFNGLGHNIDGLYIYRPNDYYVSLFGYVEGGTIRNLSLTNIDITGDSDTGAIAGELRNRGTQYDRIYGIIENTSSSGSITMHSGGGLVGSNSGKIYNSHTDVKITATTASGGFVGNNFYGLIEQCWSAGEISGRSIIGGFTGYNWGTINNCFASQSIYTEQVGEYVPGGFIGSINQNGQISNCYSASRIHGEGGGFVGEFLSGGYESDVATKEVINCYYDTNVFTGSAVGWVKEGVNWEPELGITGLTTDQMKSKSSFSGWDFDTIWKISNGGSYPVLRNDVLLPDYTTQKPDVDPGVTPDNPDNPEVTPPTEPNEPDTPVVPPVTPDGPNTPTPPVTPDEPDTPAAPNVPEDPRAENIPTDFDKLAEELQNRSETARGDTPEKREQRTLNKLDDICNKMKEDFAKTETGLYVDHAVNTIEASILGLANTATQWLANIAIPFLQGKFWDGIYAGFENIAQAVFELKDQIGDSNAYRLAYGKGQLAADYLDQGVEYIAKFEALYSRYANGEPLTNEEKAHMLLYLEYAEKCFKNAKHVLSNGININIIAESAQESVESNIQFMAIKGVTLGRDKIIDTIGTPYESAISDAASKAGTGVFDHAVGNAVSDIFKTEIGAHEILNIVRDNNETENIKITTQNKYNDYGKDLGINLESYRKEMPMNDVEAVFVANFESNLKSSYN